MSVFMGGLIDLRQLSFGYPANEAGQRIEGFFTPIDKGGIVPNLLRFTHSPDLNAR